MGSQGDCKSDSKGETNIEICGNSQKFENLGKRCEPRLEEMDEKEETEGLTKSLTQMALLSPEESNSSLCASSKDGESLSEKIREKEESFLTIFVSVFIPFLIAGTGMVSAGLLLDVVQHWVVFEEIPEIFILLPALLGLKGNLEMTLASRLSTQANLGKMDTRGAQWRMMVANISLVQCQAIVVGFLASMAALILGYFKDKEFTFDKAMVLCSGSILTASVASFVLGTITVIVIVASRRLKINPDNVATPIAASLGDLTTLALLTFISGAIYSWNDKYPWITYVFLTGYLVSMPLWIIMAWKHELTREVLLKGWTPVLVAMLISSCGGLILNVAIEKFSGIAVFQPVMNGVGGNLVAVQASRISTSFHIESKPGKLARNSKICSKPFGTFFARDGHARTARALILMVIPGALIFCNMIRYLKAGHTTVSLVFVLFYLVAALIQVIFLLYVAEVLIKLLWVKRIDPDNAAIPYLTALGDLVGTSLLAGVFYLLWALGDIKAEN